MLRSPLSADASQHILNTANVIVRPTMDARMLQQKAHALQQSQQLMENQVQFNNRYQQSNNGSNSNGTHNHQAAAAAAAAAAAQAHQSAFSVPNNKPTNLGPPNVDVQMLQMHQQQLAQYYQNANYSNAIRASPEQLQQMVSHSLSKELLAQQHSNQEVT